MKIQKKKIAKEIIIMVISIGILFGLLTIQSDAANQTNTSSNTQTNTTAGKSNNANLSNLGIRPHDFSGFKAATTSYEVTVPETTESVEVYAKAQNEKAKVSGTGNKKLEKGTNKIEVVVTAEDGTSKTYTLNIIRGTKQEGNMTNVENAKGLSTLRINNLSLSPEFKTNIYEYTAKYVGEGTTLNIETIPTSENYVVKVTGNDNLQDGENNIIISVSEENGNNVATYQIKVNNEATTSREEMKKKKQEQKTIIGTVVILICIIIIIVMIQKRKKYLKKEFSKAINYNKEEDEKNVFGIEKEQERFSEPINNGENKREYTNPVNDEENRQEYANPVNNEENRQEYTNLVNNEENRQEYTNLVNNEENRQEYTNSVNNEENKQEYTNSVNNEENKQEYTNSVNNEENRQEYTSPVYNEENRQEYTSPLNYEENTQEDEHGYKEEYEEDEIEKMPKDEIRERFLNNFTSKMDTDFDDGYQDSRRRGKHKGKRFK